MSEGKWIRGMFDKLFAREQYVYPTYQLLSGTIAIPEDAPSVLHLDANGAARNVDMPAPSTNIEGKIWTIQNPAGGAFSLTVRNNGGTTIATVAQGKCTQIVVYNKAGTLTWVQLNLLA